MSTMIAVPSTGTTHTRTAVALADLCRHSADDIHSIAAIQSCYIHSSRERHLQMALESSASHLLFVDSDMLFKPDTLERLLERDKGIIGAAYNMRVQRANDLERVTTVKFLDEEYEAMKRGEPVRRGEVKVPGWPEEPFIVKAVGTGMMLIRLADVRDMPRPWFFFEGDTLEDPKGAIGEDVWFCLRAAEHGVPVWCDPTIPMGHLGEYLY